MTDEYVSSLEEALRREREIADALAVELSSCSNSITWMFNTNISEALERWKDARKNLDNP